MVRRSQTSNPRSAVVLTSGADWRERTASQRRSSGGDFPLPKGQAGKIDALQRTIKVLRLAINTKHRSQARYLFSRARALVEALPASQTVQERQQLSELRKKFAAGGKALPQSAKKSKPKPKSASKPKPKVAQKPKPTRTSGLGDRFINREALGYVPVDETKRPQKR